MACVRFDDCIRDCYIHVEASDGESPSLSLRIERGDNEIAIETGDPETFRLIARQLVRAADFVTDFAEDK
jgi:hypothetical protein